MVPSYVSPPPDSWGDLTHGRWFPIDQQVRQSVSENRGFFILQSEAVEVFSELVPRVWDAFPGGNISRVVIYYL